jgi:hypothetical protein
MAVPTVPLMAARWAVPTVDWMAAKWDGYSADYSVPTMAASRAVRLAALLAHRKVGRTEYLLVAQTVSQMAAQKVAELVVNLAEV